VTWVPVSSSSIIDYCADLIGEGGGECSESSVESGGDAFKICSGVGLIISHR